MIDVISDKDRRINRWHTISKEPLNDLEPGRWRDLGIYSGAQGIWIDPPRTVACNFGEILSSHGGNILLGRVMVIRANGLACVAFATIQ
jgi:hypothetical protein